MGLYRDNGQEHGGIQAACKTSHLAPCLVPLNTDDVWGFSRGHVGLQDITVGMEHEKDKNMVNNMETGNAIPQHVTSRFLKGVLQRRYRLPCVSQISVQALRSCKKSCRL